METPGSVRRTTAANRPAHGVLAVVLRRAWIGPVCLLAGIAIGRQWTAGGDPAPVWREGGAGVQEPAASPSTTAAQPSFATACERVAGGVVAVQAIVFAEAAGAGAEEPLTGLHVPVRPHDAGPIGTGASGGRPSRVARNTRGVSNGSGFVVNAEKKLVVTARHVVVDAALIRVDVPQLGAFDAEIVGEDPLTDVAVLRLIDAPDALRAVELGRSEALRAGDWVVAIGNPYGFSQTVTAGIVSFVGRHLPHYDLRVTNDFLQFSAPVHPGSSGSPVVDAHGSVVGLTTQATDAGEGISFAIPSRTLKWVLREMDRSADGRVHRGYLGIEFETQRGNDERGRPHGGARVRRVAEGEPAQRAGLFAGDVVLFVDGHRVADAGDLHDRITRTPPGTQVRLTVQRDAALLDVEVVLRDALGPLEQPKRNVGQ